MRMMMRMMDSLDDQVSHYLYFRCSSYYSEWYREGPLERKSIGFPRFCARCGVGTASAAGQNSKLARPAVSAIGKISASFPLEILNTSIVYILYISTVSG